MYLPNKYTKWYYQIIDRAVSRKEITGYTEKHHIIPRSLGGSNRKDNLVKLTAKEHFICHLLLIRMVEGKSKIKMIQAVWRMTVKGSNFQDRYKPSSKTYELLRLQFGSLRKGIKTSDIVKQKISKANKGKIAWNKGIPRTDNEKILMSIKRKEKALIVKPWNIGKSHSLETLTKIKEKAKTRIKYKCQYCSKQMTGANFFRWHGDNCKLK